jgi:alkanesulfonate monooxygenase SsuD/methylene tetrahydromethanopterin reductase-like flavin-dependent oxidoreductase (luciferase family)
LGATHGSGRLPVALRVCGIEDAQHLADGIAGRGDPPETGVGGVEDRLGSLGMHARRTSFRLVGLDPRPKLPIFIAALSPSMLTLAGELGDGVMLWLCNPNYIRDVVVPAVRAGRDRAGRSIEGFEIVAAVPAALTDDRAAASDAMRSELLTYFSLPFYRTMLERSGHGEDIAAFDAARGDGARMRAAMFDGFVEALTAVGDEAAVRAGVARYVDAGVTLPCVGPISKTDFEGTLRAAAP